MAAGRGTRAGKALKDDPVYRVPHIEHGAGLARLRDRGSEAFTMDEVCPQADVVLLTVPDEAGRSG